MAEAIAIRAAGLTRHFETVTAVDDLTLEVPAGTVFGFLGPNGAGKTTTIRMLLGLLEATTGEASVLGHDSQRDGDAVRRRCGVLLEHAGLYERLSAADNLEFFARLWHIPVADRQQRIIELLAHFSLAERRDEIVNTWSRGMKQKLALARALLHRPQVIFLDEPTAGLDPVAAASLRTDLLDLARRETVTVFITTHNLDEAERMCDRVGVIRSGRLIAEGPPDTLRQGTARTVTVDGSGFGPALDALRRLPEVATVQAENGQLRVELTSDAPGRAARAPARGVRRRHRRGPQGRGLPGGGVPRAARRAGGERVTGTVMDDVRTVAWKELREILQRGERRRRSPGRQVILPVLIGIFFGLQTLRGSIGFAIYPVGLFAMSTALGLVTDAVAGERERHTLETLLASPVPDVAILAGKLIAVVGYVWVLSLAQLAAVEITSVAVGHPVPASTAVAVAFLSVFEAVLAAAFGLQFSLRAPTVREAARKTGQLGFLVILPVSLLNVFVVENPGETWSTVLVAVAVVALVASDVGLVVLARARFRRSRLLLD